MSDNQQVEPPGPLKSREEKAIEDALRLVRKDIKIVADALLYYVCGWAVIILALCNAAKMPAWMSVGFTVVGIIVCVCGAIESSRLGK